MLESRFDKVASLQACNFIKKRFQHRCFPVKFVKFLRAHILKNICERLLLNFANSMSISFVWFNPFEPNVPFLYPLKKSENLWFLLTYIQSSEKWLENVRLSALNPCFWLPSLNPCIWLPSCYCYYLIIFC